MIKFEDVSKSYNGKSGCMCGCNGNYSIPSSTDIDAVNKEVGYIAYDKDNVSDRRVKIAVNKINKALTLQQDTLEGGRSCIGGVSVGINDNHAWVNDNGRNTVVYF